MKKGHSNLDHNVGFTTWTLTLSIPMKIFGRFWMSVIGNAKGSLLALDEWHRGLIRRPRAPQDLTERLRVLDEEGVICSVLFPSRAMDVNTMRDKASSPLIVGLITASLPMYVEKHRH